MAKRINITETELIKLIEHEMEDQLNLPGGYDLEDDFEDEIENEFEDDRDILTPEEIVGLMEEQIVQLQGRVDYSEELLADVLEFTSALMGDLTKAPDLKLKKSTAKLRALETRAGREIFWLKSRRL
tara:strand:- start:1479 stop:1859 length:381 start_codon:yes stop_codon:yes gene_type:complete